MGSVFCLLIVEFCALYSVLSARPQLSENLYACLAGVMDGNLSVSFYIGGWNLRLSALPSCWWLMGLFTTSSSGLEGDTEWGFCQNSGRFGWVPEPRALQPKLCLHHRSPWAFLDFNHFPNRCISVRMDKVLKLALCSLKPKLCVVLKQWGFLFFVCFLLPTKKLSGKCFFGSDSYFHHYISDQKLKTMEL